MLWTILKIAFTSTEFLLASKENKNVCLSYKNLIYSHSPIFVLVTKKTFLYFLQIWQLFIVLRQLVAILVTVFSFPAKLTNYLCLFATESQSDRVTELQTLKGTQYTGGWNFFMPDFNKLPYSLRSQGDKFNIIKNSNLKTTVK